MAAEISVEGDVERALAGIDRLTLAVSGGVDSMVLLHAAARVAAGRALCVATFDHGTGSFATSSVDFVRHAAARLGLPCTVGRHSAGGSDHATATSAVGDEATWRHERWTFLRCVAESQGGHIATAHTRDDQVETVAMRVMRGAGARGIAALYARSDILRPLLRLTRPQIVEYAARHGIGWRDDPSNTSRAHFRNRVRHDLLPAIAAVSPAFSDELLDLATRAASVRSQLDALIAAHFVDEDGSVVIPHGALSAVPEKARPIVWQSLAARAGITLDRRGTVRLAREAHVLPIGGHIPLSGGCALVRERRHYSFRTRVGRTAAPRATATLSVDTITEFGVWRFSPVPETTISASQSSHSVTDGRNRALEEWTTSLPADRALALRSWRDGDRIVVDQDGRRRRRVKRFFADRGIAALDRSGWPVVLDGEEIIWIPGIRRACAATDRSGRPEVRIHCERIDE